MGNRIGGWFRRLTSDSDELDADALSSEVDAAGAQRACNCRVGQQVVIHGRLRCVNLQPTESLASVVAELYDGTDAVDLVWLGRRSIAGVEAGRTVKAHGRISLRDGRKVMYNPDYELFPAHS